MAHRHTPAKNNAARTFLDIATLPYLTVDFWIFTNRGSAYGSGPSKYTLLMPEPENPLG
jgi:hypothetical protein